MRARSSKTLRLLAGALLISGVSLLLWWAVSLYAYGIEVDATSSVGSTRPVDVILFGSGAVCIATATAFYLSAGRQLTRAGAIRR